MSTNNNNNNWRTAQRRLQTRATVGRRFSNNSNLTLPINNNNNWRTAQRRIQAQANVGRRFSNNGNLTLPKNNKTWRNVQREKKEHNLRNPGLFNRFKNLFRTRKQTLRGKNVRVTNF